MRTNEIGSQLSINVLAWAVILFPCFYKGGRFLWSPPGLHLPRGPAAGRINLLTGWLANERLINSLYSYINVYVLHNYYLCVITLPQAVRMCAWFIKNHFILVHNTHICGVWYYGWRQDWGQWLCVSCNQKLHVWEGNWSINEFQTMCKKRIMKGL